MSCQVLVVEDNKINQVIIKKLLSNKGIDVVLADNGEDAISSLARYDISLVIMDIKMPVMDGITASRIIKSDFKDIPVVVLSASVDDDDREAAFSAGVDDYLIKPVTSSMINELINKWKLSNSRVDNKLSFHSFDSFDSSKNDIFILEKKLPSFDILRALAYSEGNMNFLLSVLQDFKIQLESFLVEVISSFESNDIHSLGRITHTLKSTSALLGAVSLSDNSTSINNMTGRSQLPNSVEQSDFIDQIKSVIGELDNFFCSKEKVFKVKISRSDAVSFIYSVISRLESYYVILPHDISQLNICLEYFDVDRNIIENIISYIKYYEYDKAKDLISSLKLNVSNWEPK